MSWLQSAPKAFGAGPTAKMAVLPLRRQDITFHQGVAGGVIFPAHDRGGVLGRANNDDGRLIGIGRRKTTGLNLRLLTILPVVVRGEQCPLAITELQRRIRQHIGNAKLRKRRSQPAHNPVPGDETPNHDILIWCQQNLSY